MGKVTKPIFVVRIPGNRINISIEQFTENLNSVIGEDYHPLLVLNDNSITEYQFELYNVQNASEIEIEELKKRVLTNLNES